VYYDLQLLFLVHVLPAQQIVGPEPPPGTTSEEEHSKTLHKPNPGTCLW